MKRKLNEISISSLVETQLYKSFSYFCIFDMQPKKMFFIAFMYKY